MPSVVEILVGVGEEFLTGEALKSIRRSKLSENLALPYTLNGVLSL